VGGLIDDHLGQCLQRQPAGAQRLRRRHGREALDLVDHGDVAEQVPGQQISDVFTVDRRSRPTGEDDEHVRAAVALCPIDRLLVETDSPFLAPVPHRGRANEPSYLPLVGEAVAAVKGCPVDEVRERSAAAANMVFSTGS